MGNSMKKGILILFGLFIMVAFFPVETTVFAQETEQKENVYNDEGWNTVEGTQIKWKVEALAEEGEGEDKYVSEERLLISGTGVIPHFSKENIPWATPNGDVPVTEVFLENGITGIEEKAFEGYGLLETVEIKGNITDIKAYAFGNCVSLSNVKAESISSIKGSAFNKCDSLKSIDVTGKIDNIENSAFSGCTSLNKVSAGSITNIIESAFSG